MRNIPVSVHDDTYRRSRIRAAELDTSVSALVRGFLEGLVGDRADGARAETKEERRRRLLEEGGIHTQGDSVDEIRRNVKEAVDCYFDEAMPRPKLIRLHFVRDEVLVA